MHHEESSHRGPTAGAPLDPAATLEHLLRAHPHAVVAALDPAGVVVPVPPSFPVGPGHQRFEGGTAIALLVPQDQVRLLEAWTRVAEEPVVETEVRLLAEPTQPSTIHLLDVRADHGVHAVVVDLADPTTLERSMKLRDAQLDRVAHVERDGLAVFLAVDEATTRLLGWTPEEMVGQPSAAFVHPDDIERAVESWAAMRAGIGSGRSRVRYRHRDGHHLWLEVTSDNRLEDPAVGCVLSDLVDVSDEMAQLEDLRAREQLLGRLAEALPIGVCHLRSDGEVAYANAPMHQLFGDLRRGRDVVHRVAPSSQVLVAGALDASLTGRPTDLEVDLPHPDGDRRCELTFRPLGGPGGDADGVILCAADVTARSRLQSELQHRADHDTLSGSLNRAATMRALDEALRSAPQVAVAFIDVDQLKVVNDVLGHAVGDALLHLTATRLRRAIRAQDRLGRIGGDEFAVICPLTHGPVELEALGARLGDAVNGEVWLSDHRVQLAASVGLAVSEPGELDGEAVLGRADAAMYERKRERAEARDPARLPFTVLDEDRRTR